MCLLIVGGILPITFPATAVTAQELPTHLAMDEALEAKLLALAGGLQREIALCLVGVTERDSAWVTDFVMPVPTRSTRWSSSFATCPPETLALWHNHPATSAEPGQEFATALRNEPVTNPLVVCALSLDDIATTVELGFPFAVVAVDHERWCWWTLEQVRQFQRRQLVPGPLQLIINRNRTCQQLVQNGCGRLLRL